jgi:hypothetical protein
MCRENSSERTGKEGRRTGERSDRTDGGANGGVKRGRGKERERERHSPGGSRAVKLSPFFLSLLLSLPLSLVPFVWGQFRAEWSLQSRSTFASDTNDPTIQGDKKKRRRKKKKKSF